MGGGRAGDGDAPTVGVAGAAAMTDVGDCFAIARIDGGALMMSVLLTVSVLGGRSSLCAGATSACLRYRCRNLHRW